MRWLYTFFYYLAVPFIILRLWWRGFRLPAYRGRWSERFAKNKIDAPAHCWWLHAVSVGEWMAARPLIKMIHEKYPDVTLLVTTMTPTASKLVQKECSDWLIHQYIPYDLPDCWARFITAYQPKVAITMETELWPNMCSALKKRRVPWLLANARLSTRSCYRYMCVRWFVQFMFRAMSCVAAQTPLDAAHFIALGVPIKKVKTTGNIKFDIQAPADCLPKAEQIRQSWGKDRPVWIAASTHDGEEAIVLDAFLAVKKQKPNALLVLAMRHPERVEQVSNLLNAEKLSAVRRSLAEKVLPETDVVVADTLGELFYLYAASDVVFVGGSLVPVGGHNLIEPAAVAKPIITGPYLRHFVSIKNSLLAANALMVVDDKNQLTDAVVSLLDAPEERQAMAEKALRVVAENKGALVAQMQCLQTMVNES